MNIKKVGILYRPKGGTTLDKAKELERAIKTQGIPVWICSAWEKEKAQSLLEGTDLLLTVGGDGTILWAVQSIIPRDTLITGINQGKLGFLTELAAGEAVKKLPRLLQGKGWIDRRVMLQAEVVSQAHGTCVYHALNDVVVARGGAVRLIRIETSIDNHVYTTYSADAVILATATGSTGYALAAGGPVICPPSEDILLAPVAPHLSPAYPLILPGTAVIKLCVQTYHAATLSIDGIINLPLADGDTVTIRRSPYAARFLRLKPEGSFYSSLEGKLKGIQGESRRKS
jgi:NAD+ kinase